MDMTEIVNCVGILIMLTEAQVNTRVTLIDVGIHGNRGFYAEVCTKPKFSHIMGAASLKALVEKTRDFKIATFISYDSTTLNPGCDWTIVKTCIAVRDCIKVESEIRDENPLDR